MTTTTTTLLWLIPVVLFNAYSCHAFTIPRGNVPLSSKTLVSRLTRDEFSSAPSVASSRTNDDYDSIFAAHNNGAQLDDQSIKLLQSTEIQQVRKEMVQKFLELGRTPEEALFEVDQFLLDPEQSHPYLEMRRSAKSQELVGPEFFVQLIGSFAVGWLAMAYANRLEMSGHQ